MDLCRKIQNAVCWEKKQFQVELSLRINLVQSVLNDRFSHSQEAAQSQDVFLLLFLLLVPSHLLHLSLITSSPSSGLLVFQFQAGRPLPRPSGICSAAHSAFIKQRVRKTTTSVPFFMYDPLSSRTSFRGSLLFFYFEVEFLHLCLTWKKNKTRGDEQNLVYIQATKKKEK